MEIGLYPAYPANVIVQHRPPRKTMIIIVCAKGANTIHFVLFSQTATPIIGERGNSAVIKAIRMVDLILLPFLGKPE